MHIPDYRDFPKVQYRFLRNSTVPPVSFPSSLHAALRPGENFAWETLPSPATFTKGSWVVCSTSHPLPCTTLLGTTSASVLCADAYSWGGEKKQTLSILLSITLLLTELRQGGGAQFPQPTTVARGGQGTQLFM